MFQEIKKLFNIKKERKRRLYIVLVFFIFSFSVVRLYSLNFTHFIFIDGYHIHHFYFGMAALFLGGILAIANDNNRIKLRIASVMIGIGSGLFADEIGLLLNCTTADHFCSYAFPDMGDIVSTIILVIIFLIVIIDNDTSIIKAIKEKINKLKKIF